MCMWTNTHTHREAAHNWSSLCIYYHVWPTSMFFAKYCSFPTDFFNSVWYVQCKAAGGQSDSQHDKGSAVTPSSFPLGKWLQSGFIHITYPLCESHTQDEQTKRTAGSFSHRFLEQHPKFLVKNYGTCTWFSHLQDPFRVLQCFKEGVLRVGRGRTGSAGPQQLFKSSFYLPCVCKVHRHQFTVQRGVHSEALQRDKRARLQHKLRQTQCCSAQCTDVL